VLPQALSTPASINAVNESLIGVNARARVYIGIAYVLEWSAVNSRRACSLLAALLATAGVLLIGSPAEGDSANSLTVVGTSDVSDSGLMANVIQPAFQAAYPQYTFKYIGKATGTAISYAETGAFGPSVMIVHAASLENQFVAGGYSDERYGRAIFRNDFVLAGPKRDPAGVDRGHARRGPRANAAHNIAAAFADIAAAGIARHATFVSRGGTPGTTVAEHQIWAIVDRFHLAPRGLVLCAVNDANGGGETPIGSGSAVQNGQPCPSGGALPVGGALPSWYAVSGLTQGPNVQLADACPSSIAAASGSCYVFTDRGTYDYLRSGTDPEGSASSLKVVTSDNSASAPGGATELINYFHAYAINPSKPHESVNLTAAEAFLNLVTSPTMQAAIGRYLKHSGDPGGAPFVPDASPIIVGAFPQRVTEGARVTIHGTLSNAEIGYPAPAGLGITVDRIVGGIPLPVAAASTSSRGAYAVSFRPAASGLYELSTPQAGEIENRSLSPVFGDILSPAATAPRRLTVTGPALRFTKVTVAGQVIAVEGSLGSAPLQTPGTVELLARLSGRRTAREVGHVLVSPGRKEFRLDAGLPGSGQWTLTLEFRQAGVHPSHSAGTTVTIP
jgi:ABC-type tungstate transport system permease subunit